MVKIFWKNICCETCYLMKELGETLQDKGHPVQYLNVRDEDALIQFAFYDIIPILALTDQDGEEIIRYEGFVPLLAEVEEAIIHIDRIGGRE